MMLRTGFRSTPTLICLLVALFLGATPRASASTFTVGCNVPDLIAAINSANISSSDDVINLSSGCTYTLTNDFAGIGNGLTPGLPGIFNTLTINGHGATIERSSDLLTPTFGLISVPTGGNLTLNDVTLRNGASGAGGAIVTFNGGVVTVNNVTFVNNSALYYITSTGGAISNFNATLTINNSTFIDNQSPGGGAVYNDGNLTVNNSTFSGNLATSSGGAIANNTDATAVLSNSTISGNIGEVGGGISNTGNLTVQNSTVSGNAANFTGGIINLGGTVIVSNSTISDNRAGQIGGLYNLTFDFRNAVMTVSNSTIAGNHGFIGAGLGGGAITNRGERLDLGSSIVANNTMEVGDDPDLTGTINSLGYNVIGNTNGATLTGDIVTNQINGDAVPLNLNALANNGGPTQTRSLGSPSVAFSRGNCTSLPGVAPIAVDQRGIPRNVPCDVGAFELFSEPTSVFGGESSGASVTGSCSDIAFLSDGAIAASCADGVYFHQVVIDGEFLTNPAEIGIQSILDLGVLHAVNLVGMGPGGTPTMQFNPPLTICLRGTGDILFVSASDLTRTIQRPSAVQSGDIRCVTIGEPGLLVMVNQPGFPPSESTTSVIITVCQVTTTDAPLNLRAEPNTHSQVYAKLPYDITLAATEFVPGWYKVIYLDGQGWVSADFVRTTGACG
jgi:hypothetical protein